MVPARDGSAQHSYPETPLLWPVLGVMLILSAGTVVARAKGKKLKA